MKCITDLQPGDEVIVNDEYAGRVTKNNNGLVIRCHQKETLKISKDRKGIHIAAYKNPLIEVKSMIVAKRDEDYHICKICKRKLPKSDFSRSMIKLMQCIECNRKGGLNAIYYKKQSDELLERAIEYNKKHPFIYEIIKDFAALVNKLLAEKNGGFRENFSKDHVRIAEKWYKKVKPKLGKRKDYSEVIYESTGKTYERVRERDSKDNFKAEEI